MADYPEQEVSLLVGTFSFTKLPLLPMSSIRFRGKLGSMKDYGYTTNNKTLPHAEAEFAGRKEIPVVFGSHGIDLYGKIMLPANTSASNPVPGAVLCHGFGADRKVMESSALLLVNKGIATIVFDLRGHGLSGGCLDGNFYEDVIDAWQTLTGLPEVDSSRVALIGHSLGALSSILAARKIKKPKAIVALSCPAEVNGMIYKDHSRKAFTLVMRMITLIWRITIWLKGMKVRVDWKKFLESFPQMKLSSALAELDECAKLFVFGASDLLTPYRRFIPVYEIAPGPKQKMLTGGSHGTPLEAEILCFEWVGWTVAALTSKKPAV
jgi:pimeloyl-ACP methyl ester carboxylesterase